MPDGVWRCKSEEEKKCILAVFLKIGKRKQNSLSFFFHFLTNVLYIWLCLDNTSHCIDYLVESCKFTVFLFESILPNLKGH